MFSFAVDFGSRLVLLVMASAFVLLFTAAWLFELGYMAGKRDTEKTQIEKSERD